MERERERETVVLTKKHDVEEKLTERISEITRSRRDLREQKSGRKRNKSENTSDSSRRKGLMAVKNQHHVPPFFFYLVLGTFIMVLGFFFSFIKQEQYLYQRGNNKNTDFFKIKDQLK